MSEKEKLLAQIQQDETIQRYKRIEDHINKNIAIKRKINELKTIQKQMINAKEIQKTAAYDALLQEYNQRLQEIEDFPLMSDYLALQSEINYVLQTILSIIEEGIQEDLDG